MKTNTDKILLGFIIMLAPLLSTTLTLACVLEDVYNIVLTFFIAMVMVGVYIAYVKNSDEVV